jgi:cobalt-zinc-cadmium efflux system protein
VPEDVDTERLQSEILAIEGVEGLHDLHLWSQDGASHVMTLHVVVCEGLAPADLQRIKEAVRDTGCRHSADHVTVEFEQAAGFECEYARDDR